MRITYHLEEKFCDGNVVTGQITVEDPQVIKVYDRLLKHRGHLKLLNPGHMGSHYLTIVSKTEE